MEVIKITKQEDSMSELENKIINAVTESGLKCEIVYGVFERVKFDLEELRKSEQKKEEKTVVENLIT